MYLQQRPHKAFLTIVLAALLLAGNLALLHKHQDGMTHYSDCDQCLQIHGLSATTESGASLLTLQPPQTVITVLSHRRISSIPSRYSARAPPAHFL